MTIQETGTLDFHLGEVRDDKRRFENASQSISRMILEKGFEKITRGGRAMYDFNLFRQGDKHIIGWHDEINDFVNFTKDASEDGSSKEMAFVLIGEPGNGKTFFVEYLCSLYRKFLLSKHNRRYTIKFCDLENIGTYGNIQSIRSQTFEDPLILAMNLFGPNEDQNKEYLLKMGFKGPQIDKLYSNYRPLGACSEYIWNDIKEHCDGDIEKMLSSIKIVPVPISESQGTVTGKYSARDKITSSATDLLGEEDISRILHLSDSSNPYKYDIQIGAIARVACGGIHFSDEIFRNKKDLVQIYLQVIQSRTIELKGYKWPIDALIIGTSNNDVYNQFVADKEEAPIKDRCHICYVGHNTDYKLQHILTGYSIGSKQKTTIIGENLHEDPNLNYATSVAVTLTRLLHSKKLNPVEMMKLEAGEVAGEKSVATLSEVKKEASMHQDVTKRWGQKGIGHRGLGRIFQRMLAMPETHEGACLFARDCFDAVEREIVDYVSENMDREKYLKDLELARKLYRKRIKTSIFNAYRDDPDAVRKDVLMYINMIIGINADQDIGPDKQWRYKDPQTGEMKVIKIDELFIESVESRLGLNSQEAKETFRNSMRRIYGQKISTDPNYDFMDNESLVKAVTDVRLESDVAGAGSLVGALSNQTNEENVKIRNRMIGTMLDKLGYCRTCAAKTIEYYCEKEDES